ncbi:MAG: transcription termination/antitermination protein NusG [Thermodesulfobacteriota bacterium]|jgi:transcription antitermination factor NusG
MSMLVESILPVREIYQSENWYAVYTKSRHEKVVETVLKSRGVKTFLPLREILSQWKDRKKLINIPLFPCYLFVKIGPADIYDVAYTKGVLRIVGCNGTPVAIPAGQIEAIMKVVQNKLKYDPYPYLDEGRDVIIKRGPLQGILGKIVDKKSSKHKLIVSIELIKRSVSIEVDVLDIEAL